MDEVDGRPGAVASQFGHIDAIQGIRPLSLPLPTTFLQSLRNPFFIRQFSRRTK
jgi:hypothetical protein